MTDPRDPLDPIDELDALASDHLDGRTTGAEDARLATDQGAAARLAAVRAARDALREEVPVDAGAREAAIAAALEAFDAEGAKERTASLAPVTGPAIGPAPSRRRLQLVALAAALALLALAVPLLAGLDRSGDDEDTAATALDEDTSGRGGADLEAPTPGAAEDSLGGGSAQAYTAAAPVALGTFPDVAALADAVRAAVPTAMDRALPSTTAAHDGARSEAALAQDTCAGAHAAAELPTFSGTATLDGRAVLVLVRAAPAGSSELVVLDAADCSVVATRPL